MSILRQLESILHDSVKVLLFLVVSDFLIYCLGENYYFMIFLFLSQSLLVFMHSIMKAKNTSNPVVLLSRLSPDYSSESQLFCLSLHIFSSFTFSSFTTSCQKKWYNYLNREYLKHSIGIQLEIHGPCLPLGQ